MSKWLEEMGEGWTGEQRMSGWPGGLGVPGKAQVALKGFELCWFKLPLRKATAGADEGLDKGPDARALTAPVRAVGQGGSSSSPAGSRTW